MLIPRTLTAADLDAIDSLQPADWNSFHAAFERYFTLPCVSPYGIEENGALKAMGTLIQFGTSAWIAQLITHPDSRGRGLGSEMMAFLLQEAGRRGVRTISLVATDQGYPLYVKNGFRVEGEYCFFSRSEPAPAEPAASAGLVPWDQAGADGLLNLDREVSGEERVPYLGRTADGLVAPHGEGFFLPRIGEGLVVARTERAGIPLLHCRIDGATRVAFPIENAKAALVLKERGFAEQRRMRRMVLGPSLQRRPEWQWSRIAGNLG